MSATTTPAPRVCRGCGCTDADGCLVGVPARRLAEEVVSCWWVEDDLCACCANPAWKVRGPVVDHRAAPAGEAGDAA